MVKQCVLDALVLKSYLIIWFLFHKNQISRFFINLVAVKKYAKLGFRRPKLTLEWQNRQFCKCTF